MLQMKVAAEGKILDDRIRQFSEDWARERPISGDTKCGQALETLKIFEGRLVRLKEEQERISKVIGVLVLNINRPNSPNKSFKLIGKGGPRS